MKESESSSSASVVATDTIAAVHVPQVPVVRPYKSMRWSWIWLVPLVAALVGLSLVVRSWMHIGPTITITFESADGLEVGQTKLRYKDVVIGQVTDLRVAPDRENVIVSVQLDREGSDYITQQGTRFWVVRPRLGISGVSGLGTLLSGAYIAVDTRPELAGNDDVFHFKGLETPPEITSGRPGTRYTLTAPDLGSLDIGSPVYYRRITVGQVIGYSLDMSGNAVNIQIFVDAPNDRFITQSTRFWNASGFNVDFSASGLKVETESLVSVVAGGVAFDSVDPQDRERAEPDSRFELASTRTLALAEPDGTPFPVEFRFYQSVRGLSVGAPIDFRGLELGNVTDIDLELDRENKQFFALVKANLYPRRFGVLYDRLIALDRDHENPAQALVAPLVQHGLRAQLRTGNLLTGQQFIALDFFPDSPSVDFDPNKNPLMLPTVAGSFDRIQQQVSSIVTKLDAMPFDEIATEFKDTLAATTALLKRVDSQATPQAVQVLKTAEQTLRQLNKLLSPDSALTGNIEGSLRDIGQAAKSLRALADYIQANPSTLLRGRPAETLKVSP